MKSLKAAGIKGIECVLYSNPAKSQTLSTPYRRNSIQHAMAEHTPQYAICMLSICWFLFTCLFVYFFKEAFLMRNLIMNAIPKACLSDKIVSLVHDLLTCSTFNFVLPHQTVPPQKGPLSCYTCIYSQHHLQELPMLYSVSSCVKCCLFFPGKHGDH